MRFVRQHIGWLSCFALLVLTTPSCRCYVSIPPIPNNVRLGDSQLPMPLLALQSPSILPMANNIMFHRRSSSRKKLGQHKRRFQPIGVTKPFFETLEEQSGKDYAWIKPLTQPVSALMRYAFGALTGLINFQTYLYVYCRSALTGLVNFQTYSFVYFRRDIIRRREVYLSDWTDGFKNLKKVIPAILFLYFACLSPAVSFGSIASQITNDSIGIVEFLLSAGASGMVSEEFIVYSESAPLQLTFSSF
jgi:hypothetical protein